MSDFLSLWEKSFVTTNIGIDDEVEILTGLKMLTQYETIKLPVEIVCMKRFGFFSKHPELGWPYLVRPTRKALLETEAPASLVDQIAVFVCANFPAYIVTTDKISSGSEQPIIRIYCGEILPPHDLPPPPHEKVHGLKLDIHSFRPSFHESVYISQIIYTRFRTAISGLKNQVKMLEMLTIRSSTIRNSFPLLEVDKETMQRLLI